MKKLLSILLAMTLVIFAFAGCQSDSATETSATESAEDKAVNTVESFFDAFLELDGDTMTTYLSDKSAMDSFPFANADDFAELVYANFPAELEDYKSDFQPMVDALIEKITDYLDYEIIGVEKNGDDFDVTVEMSIPGNVDIIANAYTEAFGEDALNAMLEEALANGTLTEESSEDEIMTVIISKVVKLSVDMINESELESETSQSVYTVSEIDGKWLIIPAE